jgi:hypothetical protein
VPWEDRVFYQSDVVTHLGATYQAVKDTGYPPPSKDWICLSEAGADGRDGLSFHIRGTWDAETDYQALDVVALNGASFAARCDGPGVCPGEDWQMIAMQGKRGPAGERGFKGDKGDRGPPGSAMSRAYLSDEGMLVLVNGDGSQITVDFYPLLSSLTR